MARRTLHLSDPHLPSTPQTDGDEQQPEVRLELTRAGVQEVLSLYSQEQRSARDEPSFTLRFEDVQRAIEERRQMLLLGFGAGLAIALVVILATTPLYPVSAQVVIEQRDVSTRGTTDRPGTAGSAFVATQAEIMQSHSVIADAVASIPLASHLDEESDPVDDALDSVTASPVSGTHVVVLGYLGPDEDHGVRLLTAIVEAYRRAIQGNEQAVQQEKLQAKQAEIDILAGEANELEAKLTAMRIKNGTLGTAEDTAEAQTTLLRDFAAQLAEARNQRIALENRLATGGDQLAILDPATRTLQQQLWDAQAELSRVRLSLKPRHPAVEAAQREVTVLQEQIRESAKATPEALKRDIAALAGLEAQLRVVYENERHRMTEIENDRREESLLIGEQERLRELSDARRGELLDQRLMTRLAEAGEVGVTARLIEAPLLPEEAVWPRPKLLFAIGGTIGLLAGFVAALVSLRLEADETEEDTWGPPPRQTRPGSSFQ